MADYSRINELMRTMLWPIMQDWMSKRSHERALQRQEQMAAGWEAHGQAEHQRALELQEIRQRDAETLIKYKASMDAATDPTLMGRIKEMLLARELEDWNKYERLNAEINTGIEELANGYTMAWRAGDKIVVDPEELKIMFLALIKHEGEEAPRIFEAASEMFRTKGQIGIREKELELEQKREDRLAMGKAPEEKSKKDEDLLKVLDKKETMLTKQLADPLNPEEDRIKAQLEETRRKKAKLLDRMEIGFAGEEESIEEEDTETKVQQIVEATIQKLRAAGKSDEEIEQMRPQIEALARKKLGIK